MVPDDEQDEASEVLRRFLLLKEGWGDIDNPRLKQERATFLFGMAMRIARVACGDELLRTVYGNSDAPDRQAALHLIAGRARLASLMFLPFDDEPYGLSAIADEARAVAQGDAPDLFNRLPGRRSAQRVFKAKLDAVRWEYYLAALGEPTASRHAAISDAFMQEWDTISRWRAQVEGVWGRRAVQDRLRADERDARRGLRRWSMKPGEDWREALARSGEVFRATVRRHAELGI